MKGATILNFPKITDSRGNLSFFQNSTLPFKIQRSYFIYDVPGGEHRGGHAFKEQKEIIVALSGSFDVVVDNGGERKIFSLNRSYYGLFIENGLWRQMENFSTNALVLVVCSTEFSEDDYVRNYSDYQEFLRSK